LALQHQPPRPWPSHLPIQKAAHVADAPADPLFAEFWSSEFVDYDEFLAWKDGKVLGFRERLQEFDSRYERPVCSACGRSAPELNTPMKDADDGTQGWAHKRSFYKCLGCSRKWQSKALKAYLAGKPVPETVKLRPRHQPPADELPDALLRRPSTRSVRG
jgi:hypothetical protein